MKKRTLLINIPACIGIVMCFFYPTIYIIMCSFMESAFSKDMVGLTNYISVMQNEYFVNAIKNTVLFTAVSVLLTIICAIVFSVLLIGVARKISFIKAILIIPFLFPPSLTTTVWDELFSDKNAFLSLVILFVFKYVGICMILLISAFCSIPYELIDIAKIEGATDLQTVFYILLPHSYPTLLFTFIFTLSCSTGVFRESQLLYGNYPHESIYMIQNYLYNHFNKLNYHLVSVGSVLFTIVVFIIALVVVKLELRNSSD